MKTYIGCSGYYYREWKGLFYPQDLPAAQWLPYYAQHFNSIEINSTFYKAPTLKSLSKWYRDTPADFVFTVKANKLFTHFRRMNNIAEEQAQFYDVVSEALQEKVRCILYQFPASVRYSEELLERILLLGGHPLLHVFEFRDISWWRPEVYARLKEAGLHFCNISLPDFPDLFVPDEAANYLRFHGKPVLYKSAYGPEGLRGWMNEVNAHLPQEIFLYFNNTWYGEAIQDARLAGEFVREMQDLQ